MTPLAVLAPNHVRAAMLAYRDVLHAHEEAVNRLNVYPVPDGDTGTNMALTLDAVASEVDVTTGTPPWRRYARRWPTGR
jgi:dihydroxyacetone kinase-like predicted kinase